MPHSPPFSINELSFKKEFIGAIGVKQTKPAVILQIFYFGGFL